MHDFFFKSHILYIFIMNKSNKSRNVFAPSFNCNKYTLFAFRREKGVCRREKEKKMECKSKH